MARLNQWVMHWWWKMWEAWQGSRAMASPRSYGHKQMGHLRGAATGGNDDNTNGSSSSTSDNTDENTTWLQH